MNRVQNAGRMNYKTVFPTVPKVNMNSRKVRHLLLLSLQLAAARYLQSNKAVCQVPECYQGGIMTAASLCDRKTEECPACLTGTASEAACYDVVNEMCQFGVDCRRFEITGDEAQKREETKEENEDPSTLTKNSTTLIGRTEVSSDMPLILGIAGGSMAVLAVGIALLMLVKKESESIEDDLDVTQESLEPYFGVKSTEPVKFEPKTPVEEEDIVAPERDSGTSCEFDDRDTSWSYDYSSSSSASDMRASFEF